MTRNNVKVLSREQIKRLNESYTFSISDNKLYVSLKKMRKTTVHDLLNNLSLNTKCGRITIRPDIVKLWHEHFYDKNTLLDVNNAVNVLTVLYQDITVDNIVDILSRHDFKIKEI